MFIENNNVFVGSSTSNYDCGVTLTEGWIHIELDIGLNPISINCQILSVGDSSASQTSALMSIVKALLYDEYTLGASETQESQLWNDRHNKFTKINDLVFDSTELNPTSNCYKFTFYS